jgi:hypothetical protein
VLRLVVAVGVLLAEGTAAHDGDIADVALVERAPAVRLCGGEARLGLGLRLRLRLRLRFGFGFGFGFRVRVRVRVRLRLTFVVVISMRGAVTVTTREGGTLEAE